MRFQKRKREKLKIISLGGWGKINGNMFVYETRNDILIIDCGIDFPDETMPGVEVIIPDVSYLADKIGKIRGIVITHGHEDHFGALPYLLPRLGYPPIFATKLVKGFIQAKLEDFKISFSKFHLVDPERDSFVIGRFKIHAFRVNHSVPDSIGLCLETPAGKIFHVSDFKLDLTPIDGKPFQIGRAARLAKPPVLGLVSDCLGAESKGYTESEREIEKIFGQIIGEAVGQVFITTISSNITRLQQAISASLRYNRKVVILGRSIRGKFQIAQKLGYVKVSKKDLITPVKAKRFPQNRVTYLVAGCYGQLGSALARIADGTFQDVKLMKDAIVVFSADPAPSGTKDTVDSMVDKLVLRGARVYYYELQENLHVSGHGSSGDIRLLFALIQPKYFVPIGGEPRHMRAYAFLTSEMGTGKDRVFEPRNGEVLEFHAGQANIIKGPKIRTAPIKTL